MNPRKPTKLKLLTGNPGKRPLPANEPQPERVMPVCPSWLTAAAKAKWKEMAPKLFRLGLLTELDGESLAMACLAWGEAKAAAETIAEEGRNFRTLNGYVGPHPALAQLRAAQQLWKTYSLLFGMDPSSRGHLSIPGEKRQDDFEEFLKNGEA